MTNEAILGELTGNGGTSRRYYSRKFHSNNRASLAQVKKESKACLIDNEIWSVGVERALSEIENYNEDAPYSGTIHIYNPSNTLVSLFQSASSSTAFEALRWVPSYGVTIEFERSSISYFGCLVRNGVKAQLSRVIDDAYKGNISMLLLSLTWGGYQSNDYDISPLYGLEYANFRCEVVGEELVFSKFDGYRYSSCHKIDQHKEYLDFMHDNHDFVEEVVTLFNDATVTPGMMQSGGH